MRNKFAALSLAALLLAGCQEGKGEPRPEATAEIPIATPETTTVDKPAVAEETGDELTRFDKLEAELEQIREILKIPGMSAGVVKNQELVWAEGFGFADLANEVPATADTPYHLASVTKPIAAALIMQLVEEGDLDLERPVSDFGVELESEGVINSWHLLTHTSAGVPGSVHNYDGSRYGYLEEVVEGVTGSSFRDLLDERILSPLGMEDTAPNLILCPMGDDDEASNRREADYLCVHEAMAKPYQLDLAYNVVDGEYQTIFSPAAGLISTVNDLARFDIALDQNELMKQETKEAMFEPLVSTYGDSDELKYGLGWYNQLFDGTNLVWHSGRWPPSISALYLKVPEEDLTFIVLANTPNLTTPFPLGYGDVMYSALAVAFYKHIVFPQLYGSDAPEIDWEMDQEELAVFLDQIEDGHARSLLQRELLARRMALMSTGRFAEGYDMLMANNRAFGPAEGLGLYDDTAAMPAPEGTRVELSTAELERLVGKYILSEKPSFLGPGEVPEEISIGLVGEILVACSDLEDEGLVLTPIAPDRLRVLGGPEGYMTFDVIFDGQDIAAINANLTDAIALTYVLEK
ncbi:MAG TPA: serine hydrolase domain-containing protein [candidate division Zixibacteria bacterium]|nr:serine hydrolase domain-containing protein [candidate division Zixibacteria bacterium]